MNKLRQKFYDWKNRLKDRHMLSLVVFFIIIIFIIGGFGFYKEQQYLRETENKYNMAFCEMVNNVERVQTFLSKSLVSSESYYSAEMLTNVWKEANLAQSYLAQLPVNNEGLSNTSRFLNQVSDYSYSLSRKNFAQENLNQDDLNNLTELYKYSIDLDNTLIQLSNEINEGKISWKQLNTKTSAAFAQEVSNISKDGFNNIEEEFHDYAGLIYDGAFSEHITNIEKKGLTGDEIDEEDARSKVEGFIGKDNIDNIEFVQKVENGNINSYEYSVSNKYDKDNKYNILISEKGGHIVYMNYNKNIGEKRIDNNELEKIGNEFLVKNGFKNMEETYYMENNGSLVINYAYNQNGIIIYSDLIKLKIAMDDGEIVGIETTGYLNSHYQRNISNNLVSKDKAKENLNKDLKIENIRLAIIPTEYKTEVLCWEYKVSLNERNFLVYINANTGKEEDILLIMNSNNGTITM